MKERLGGDLWTISTGESEPVSMATSYSETRSEENEEGLSCGGKVVKYLDASKEKFQARDSTQCIQAGRWLGLSHAIDRSVFGYAQLEQANV